MTKYSVTLLPDNKQVEVDSNSTLLTAAAKAGVIINSLCGGDGLCGECRLQVISGKAMADKNAIAFFSKDEIEHGFVLACRTKIEDNLVLLIPPKSRLEQEKILLEGTAVAYSEPEKLVLHRSSRQTAFSFDPLVKKVYLELPVPTLADNISDIDRITRELQKVSSYEKYEISLSCLQNLTEKLRAHRWKVTVTFTRHNFVGRILQIESGDTSDKHYGLAVDVGTTTVVVQLINLKTGKVVGVKGSHNLQARYGEDVISRMIFACVRGSLEPVHHAVITNINDLAHALAEEYHVSLPDITSIVAAGNTIMSHFLLNMTPCSIRLDPYVPTTTVYPQIFAREIGIEINPEGILEVAPSIASYVGGDIVAGVLACGMADKPEIRCLIDVGTNGEIVIGNNEWLVCCSASAGPAFEGGGARNGMRATNGAIEKIEINNGSVSYVTIGKSKPRGICGSGLIDAIYELVRNNIIEPHGKFNESVKSDRLAQIDGELRYVFAWPDETETGQTISISESEIANLIKSKGAIFAAIKSLVDYVGLSFDQLETIYVAGGFGSSLNIPKAIAIGLIPDIDVKHIQFIGNSSLTGARLALTSISAFEDSLKIARRMTNVELSNYTPFMNEFIAALFLPHTDAKLFPSVKYSK
jgi:uncharacterized 2Fe-2S/4Fe-4S cluster protein (DUF4445 family)